MATFTGKAPATFIRCACCPTPVVEFRDNALVIVAKHNGHQRHETVISMEQLDKLRERA